MTKLILENNSIIIPASTEAFSSNLLADKGIPTPISSWSGAEHVSFWRTLLEKLSDYFLSRRLIAPNVQKKVFLPGGATATSTSAVQVWRSPGLTETQTESRANSPSPSWSCILLPISICDLRGTEAAPAVTLFVQVFFSCKTWTGTAPGSRLQAVLRANYIRVSGEQKYRNQLLPFRWERIMTPVELNNLPSSDLIVDVDLEIGDVCEENSIFKSQFSLWFH